MSTSPGSTLLAIAFGLIELLDGPVDEPGAVPKFWLPEPAAAGLADVLLGQASRPMPRPTSTDRPLAPSAMPTDRSGRRRGGGWYVGVYGGTHWPPGCCCHGPGWPNW